MSQNGIFYENFLPSVSQNVGPNGSKSKNILIGIFQDFYALSASFFKFPAESDLNRFSIFLNAKYIVRFVIEETETSAVDVCFK